MSEPSEDLDAVWRSILAAVSHDGVPAPHRAFLSLARFVGLLDGTALVAVPNNYCKTYVERALRVPVTQAFSAHYGQDVRLAVTVDPDLDDTEDELPQPDEDTPGVGLHVVPDRADDLEDPEDGASPTHDRTAAAIATPAPTPNGRVVPEELEATRLNPKYTFDTFVIGASNRFAHAATVAEEAFARHGCLLFKPRMSTLFIWWNLLFLPLDLVYTFAFIPGIVLAFFGYYWIAGLMTLLVLPLGRRHRARVPRRRRRRLAGAPEGRRRGRPAAGAPRRRFRGPRGHGLARRRERLPLWPGCHGAPEIGRPRPPRKRRPSP